MNDLKILIPVISAIFTALISYLLPRARKKTRRLMLVKEIDALFENEHTDFNTTFLRAEKEEAAFYALTNIRTNSNNIKKYIALKNELGADWDLERIGVAQKHFNCDGEKIEVRISYLERVFSNFVLGLIACFLFGMILLVYFINLVWAKPTIYELLYMVLLFLSITAFMFFLLNIIGSVLTARSIEARRDILKELENKNNKVKSVLKPCD